MTEDISHILNRWDFDPHELNVRIIKDARGVEVIQMRIDLGMLQMVMKGRPDGQRPNGFESLLEFYQDQAKEYGRGYRLSTDAADDLFREAWQYYHRYLCLFHLGRYEGVVCDTERNIRLFEFVRQSVRKKRDKWRFDQYRPYVLMMRTRAQTMIYLGVKRKDQALAEIERGRRDIENFLREYDRSTDDTECFELDFLKRWYEEIEASSPDEGGELYDPGAEIAPLRHQLQKAIDREDYEYAAILRDQIINLEKAKSKSDM